MSAYDHVTAARANDRPTSVDYIKKLFGDSFFELHGDRRFADDKAVIGGIAELNGKPVGGRDPETLGKLRRAVFQEFRDYTGVEAQFA